MHFDDVKVSFLYDPSSLLKLSYVWRLGGHRVREHLRERWRAERLQELQQANPRVPGSDDELVEVEDIAQDAHHGDGDSALTCDEELMEVEDIEQANDLEVEATVVADDLVKVEAVEAEGNDTEPVAAADLVEAETVADSQAWPDAQPWCESQGAKPRPSVKHCYRCFAPMANDADPCQCSRCTLQDRYDKERIENSLKSSADAQPCDEPESNDLAEVPTVVALGSDGAEACGKEPNESESELMEVASEAAKSEPLTSDAGDDDDAVADPRHISVGLEAGADTPVADAAGIEPGPSEIELAPEADPWKEALGSDMDESSSSSNELDAGGLVEFDRQSAELKQVLRRRMPQPTAPAGENPLQNLRLKAGVLAGRSQGKKTMAKVRKLAKKIKTSQAAYLKHVKKLKKKQWPKRRLWPEKEVRKQLQAVGQ